MQQAITSYSNKYVPSSFIQYSDYLCYGNINMFLGKKEEQLCLALLNVLFLSGFDDALWIFVSGGKIPLVLLM